MLMPCVARHQHQISEFSSWAAKQHTDKTVRGSIVDRLLAEQLPVGSWNCEAPNGLMHSSFNTTICVLEQGLEHERAGGDSPDVTAARLCGQEHILGRRPFRQRSTGEVIERDRKSGAERTHFAFPTWWYCDMLMGLEYLRRAGVTHDERVAEAIALVESERDDGDRWPPKTQHPGQIPVLLAAKITIRIGNASFHITTTLVCVMI